jgi:hypothetical protein
MKLVFKLYPTMHNICIPEVLKINIMIETLKLSFKTNYFQIQIFKYFFINAEKSKVF